MAILDNYMFRPLLVIFRLPSRELKVLLYTGSFKKIWTSSTLATEVTGPDTVIFSYGDTLKTMPTNHKLQDRIRAAVQTTEGEQVS